MGRSGSRRPGTCHSTYAGENVRDKNTGPDSFRPRSALGDVAKAYGLEPKQVREMVDKLPHSFWARRLERDSDGQLVSSFRELRRVYPSEKHQKIFNDAEAILKLPRHLSMHPGGLVVAPGPVTDLVPVMRSGGKGAIITQLDLESVEAFGLVKIDLLGIRGLTALGDLAEFIPESQPESFSTPLSVLDSTPSDGQTADLVERGQTVGCFQIESPGMRATLREIHARSEDVPFTNNQAECDLREAKIKQKRAVVSAHSMACKRMPAYKPCFLLAASKAEMCSLSYAASSLIS